MCTKAGLRGMWPKCKCGGSICLRIPRKAQGTALESTSTGSGGTVDKMDKLVELALLHCDTVGRDSTSVDPLLQEMLALVLHSADWPGTNGRHPMGTAGRRDAAGRV